RLGHACGIHRPGGIFLRPCPDAELSHASAPSLTLPRGAPRDASVAGTPLRGRERTERAARPVIACEGANARATRSSLPRLRGRDGEGVLRVAPNHAMPYDAGQIHYLRQGGPPWIRPFVKSAPRVSTRARTG